MKRAAENPSMVENLAGLLVLVMLGAQTWIVVNEATQGDAGRWVRRWWDGRARPWWVRVVTWIDAASITDRMILEEIEPMLKGDA